MLSTKHTHSGRFANIFFQNMAVHFVARKYKLRAEYYLHDEFSRMGIHLYKDGNISSHATVREMKEDTIIDILTSDAGECGIQYIFGYYQTRAFALYLKQHMDWDSILHTNIFKTRYNTNDDVFVHVRLGDASQWNPGLQYYDSVLRDLHFQTGFITSDSPGHPIVQSLIQTYKLTLICKNEIDTIMFGSTCKHIVLSHGTFSWLIGFLGIYSNVYFPKVTTVWHGDIFVFPEWKEVDY